MLLAAIFPSKSLSVEVVLTPRPTDALRTPADLAPAPSSGGDRLTPSDHRGEALLAPSPGPEVPASVGAYAGGTPRPIFASSGGSSAREGRRGDSSRRSRSWRMRPRAPSKTLGSARIRRISSSVVILRTYSSWTTSCKRPVVQAVNDVREHLLLAGRAAAPAEEPGPERLPLLQHEILLRRVLSAGPCLGLLLWDAGL